MFCTNCGKELQAPVLCGSDVSAQVVGDRYDEKTGKRWFRLPAALDDYLGFRCARWDHIAPLCLKRMKERDMPYYHEPEGRGAARRFVYFVGGEAVTGDRVSVGPCDTDCCPHCGMPIL